MIAGALKQLYSYLSYLRMPLVPRGRDLILQGPGGWAAFNKYEMFSSLILPSSASSVSAGRLGAGLTIRDIFRPRPRQPYAPYGANVVINGGASNYDTRQ
jgi:hypothetical protein